MSIINKMPVKRLFLSVLCTVVFLTACGPPAEQATQSPAESSQTLVSQSDRPAEDALTIDQAITRKARIGEIHYGLFFDLASSQDNFSGQALIHFDLFDVDEALTLDFSGAQIDQLMVNGDALSADYNGFFITIPATSLVVGSNEVQVGYRHQFDGDGTGLHRFTDPEDGLTYLYTYLWPYYANRLFPAFDQPDLKATFDLEVKAPESWTVVSTSTGKLIDTTDSVSNWTFATTPKMSTYIFSLHAGPYKVWEDMAGDVPIRLFARQSLAGYVQVEEWFDVTRGGLEFYARYFDIKYPFGKYDQLIVPDFNIGAMENIAAVTFGEQFIQRKASDRFERENRAGVILHEMAHMWFGDLVTKQWWSELWLNESFATLMANIALVDSTEFTDAWHRFFTVNKQKAYNKDGKVTTHPIQLPIHSTADFFSVFDAITYHKGSSVLKQLAYFVGYENHRIGVSNYLKEHSYGNTTLQDFIDAQAASSGRDLDQWSQQWLYEAGFNDLSASFECSDDLLTELTIYQTASEDHPQLRQHRLKVALYQLNDDTLTPGAIIDLEIDTAEKAVAEAIGLPCPALVFPNHDDWAYARVVLDTSSIAVLDGRLQHLSDPLARSMLIQSLYDMTGSGRMPIRDYVLLALRELQSEPNIRVFAQLTETIKASVDLLFRLRPESETVLTEVLAALAEDSWKHAGAETDPDRARLWFDLLLKVSSNSVAQDRLRSLLDESVSLPAVQLSEDQRWGIVIALSGFGPADSEKLINHERERDASDQGQKLAIAADAARPDTAIKAHWLEQLVNPPADFGLARQRFAIAGMFPSHQTRLQSEQLPGILRSLGQLNDRDPYFLSSYVQGLLQPICSEESVNAMAATLESDDLNSTTALFLKEAQQADSACLKLRLNQELWK